MLAVKRGYTCLMETWLQGIFPSWWKDGKVVIFDTREEAEAELKKAFVEWRDDIFPVGDEEMGEIFNENIYEALGEWVVPCVLYDDGSLGVTDDEVAMFTPEQMKQPAWD